MCMLMEAYVISALSNLLNRNARNKGCPNLKQEARCAPCTQRASHMAGGGAPLSLPLPGEGLQDQSQQDGKELGKWLEAP